MTIGWFLKRPVAGRATMRGPRTGPFLRSCALASFVAAVVGFFSGWPLWVLVAAALLPWLPALVADVALVGRRFGPLALLYALVVTQSGHFLEHLAQMAQLHLLGLSGPHARGVFGQLDLEWVHFAWNTWVILAAVPLVLRFPRNRWLWVVAAAAWHEVEHAYLLAIYLGTGQAGTPGLLAAGGAIGGGLPLSRPDLHFLYNLIETVPLLAAFALEVRHAGAGAAPEETTSGMVALPNAGGTL